MEQALTRRAGRPYDIIVWGATGFTGQLVAEYLARSGPADLRWGIAGRSAKKLEEIKQMVESIRKFSKFQVFVADSDDKASLDAFVAQTRVVLTTVGPFMKYGMKLVESCVNNQTHYIDSTGESPFVKKAIDLYGEKAKAEGTILVPMSGFDSVPADLGSFLVAQHFKVKHGKKTAQVAASVVKMSGGISGGTLASMINIINSGEMGSAAGPYALTPKEYIPADPKAAPGPTILKYDPIIKMWRCLWLMEAVNTQVVMRSNGLFGNQYGSKFKYSEAMGRKSIFSAIAINVSMGVAIISVLIPVVRWFLAYMIPPGTGPTRKQIENGSIHMVFTGVSETASTEEKPLQAIAEIKFYKDPGYGETAKMLAESALSVLDREKMNKLPDGAFKPVPAGFLTPATAFGNILIDRLIKSNWSVTVRDA
ncbi:hypothetical protein SmJEL517_g01040 [Synchytrium microbalum]|uniref:Saccharopine dehydrogenase NADP binding domain-containing protein n=1 Tax=Synchytrium microbalum TaxID=1806994 RepID=A0A507CBJ3_9FUNG|nr:uncharacterized protein SmJEL517_g01040 [Synchytrium microbalum]TPX36992.1 hypothetical protein SmJEL517_g01040 [Synchytrium microbalum]